MKKKIFALVGITTLCFSLTSLNDNKVYAEESISATILNTDESLGIFRDLTSQEIKDYYKDLTVDDKGDSLLSNLQNILKQGQVKLRYDSGSLSSKSWDGYYLLDRDFSKSPLTNDEIKNQKYNKTGIWMNILYSTEDIYLNKGINSGEFSYYDGNSLKSIAYKNGSTQFDREHVLPKSFGFNANGDGYKDLTAGCDMQNLHAGEHNGNSLGHSNYPYGTVVEKNEKTQITSGITGEIIGYTGNNKDGIKVFEPLDVDKGDIARTVFYMCARYHTYEDLGNGDETPAISLSDAAESTTTKSPIETKDTPAYYGELSDLLEWNKLDPVDEFEIHRNNLCYNAIQHNRNPFIDYPMWADVCFSNTTYGVDLNNKDGIRKTGLDVDVESSALTIFKGDKLDLSKFSYNFIDDDGDKTPLTLNDLNYAITNKNVGIEMDLSTQTFDEKGNYEVTFSYYNSKLDKTFKNTIIVKVVTPYSIKIDVNGETSVKYDIFTKLDLSKIKINLYNKNVLQEEVKNYSVEVYDKDGNLVSTESDYKFSKPEEYKVVVCYEYDNEVLIDTYNVEVEIPMLYKIIAAIIVIILLIIILFAYFKIESAKKKSKKRKKSSTSRKKSTTKK